MNLPLAEKSENHSVDGLSAERVTTFSIEEESIKKYVLSPVKITKLLLLVAFLLLAAHVVVVDLGFVILRLFNHAPNYLLYEKIYYIFYSQFHLALEGNISSYYSSLNLAVASILSYVIHTIGKKETYHWLCLSALFLFLSLDESAQLHETFGGLAGGKIISYLDEVPPFLKWAWMLPYSILVIGVGLYFLKFTLKLPHKTRNLFYLAGTVYVFAALGLEFFESHFDTVYGEDNLMNKFLFPLEEVLEMIGIIIFIFSSLDYLMLKNIALKLSFTNKG